MEAYQQRVLSELDELTTRIAKLEIFMKNSWQFDVLPEVDRSLLEEQVAVMHSYAQVLLRRIERFKV